MRNIICFEGEWLLNSQPHENQFKLNSEPVLRFLQEYYGCEYIYRHVLTAEDLRYYLEYFRTHKRTGNKYGIVYIAAHGNPHSIDLEGEDGSIDLEELASTAGDFFENKIIHFSCCKTLSNKEAVEAFKAATRAKLVCGYEISVDPMKSAIADTALLNELMNLTNVGCIKNKNASRFRKTYQSLLDELRFTAY